MILGLVGVLLSMASAGEAGADLVLSNAGVVYAGPVQWSEGEAWRRFDYALTVRNAGDVASKTAALAYRREDADGGLITSRAAIPSLRPGETWDTVRTTWQREAPGVHRFAVVSLEDPDRSNNTFDAGEAGPNLQIAIEELVLLGDGKVRVSVRAHNGGTRTSEASTATLGIEGADANAYVAFAPLKPAEFSAPVELVVDTAVADPLVVAFRPELDDEVVIGFANLPAGTRDVEPLALILRPDLEDSEPFGVIGEGAYGIICVEMDKGVVDHGDRGHWDVANW
ncbi:MAG: hypothetical protein EP330_06610 [Deltaproteobacteria bacterium]|nr:MAG: hypothetical protein EP330_06610 [Deltaproteobacteria bacterium]